MGDELKKITSHKRLIPPPILSLHLSSPNFLFERSRKYELEKWIFLRKFSIFWNVSLKNKTSQLFVFVKKIFHDIFSLCREFSKMKKISMFACSWGIRGCQNDVKSPYKPNLKLFDRFLLIWPQQHCRRDEYLNGNELQMDVQRFLGQLSENLSKRVLNKLL